MRCNEPKPHLPTCKVGVVVPAKGAPMLRHYATLPLSLWSYKWPDITSPC